jgi:phage/conjugal plasmid C-4 type zinc finger TraR family protein
MADLVDVAQEYEAVYRGYLIAEARATRRQPTQLIDSAGHVVCLDCGDKLHKERLMAVPFASRCVGCQEASDNGEEN